MNPDAFRIGTAEREEAARVLADHLALGRITPDEYETRTFAAYQAATLAELRELFRDLPPPHPVFLAPPAQPLTPMAPMPPPPLYGAPGPYGPGPYSPVPYSPRSKTVAGVLQIVLPFGVGRFYTGQIGLGLLQLSVCVVTCGIGALWPIVDGVLLLAKGGLDAEGRPLGP